MAELKLKVNENTLFNCVGSKPHSQSYITFHFTKIRYLDILFPKRTTKKQLKNKNMRKTLLLLLFILINNPVSAQEKERIAVLPFTPNGVAEEEAVVAADLIRTTLVKTNKYIVLDRENIAKVLDEQNFQQTAYTETSNAVKMGKILNVQYIIVGTLALFGANFVLTANVINVETAEVEKSENITDMTLDNMFYMAQNLALNLMGQSEKNTNTVANDALPGINYNGIEIYQLFSEKAKKWQPDAILSELSSTGWLDAQGKTSAWKLTFWSPTTKKTYSLSYYYNNRITVTLSRIPVPKADIIPENAILDTKYLYTIAETSGEAFKYTKEGYFPMASLTISPVQDDLWVWYFNYCDGDYSVVYTVIIDAITGKVLDKIS